MKKWVGLLFGLILFSCSQENPVSEIPDQEPLVRSRYHITQEQALNHLYAFLDETEPPQSRSGERRRVKAVEAVSAPQELTRSLSYDAQDLLYIVHFEDEAGYAVLAADNRLEMILAVTDAGLLSVEDFVWDRPVSTRSSGVSSGEENDQDFLDKNPLLLPECFRIMRSAP